MKRAILGRVGLISACVIASSTWVASCATLAGAQAPARPVCPDPPVAYSGTDDVVREVRLAREDARLVCLAARSDADDAQTDADRAHADDADTRAASATDAEAIVTAVENVGQQPGPAAGQIVRLSQADADRANSTRWATMFLCGLALVGWCIFPALRRMWP